MQINEFFNFIEKSPTAFHAVRAIQEKLEENGFIELLGQEQWKLEHGGKYFVKRNGSSLASFIIPEKEVHGYHMAACHTDSPCFKVKACPEIRVEEGYVKINTEPYGGMIFSTWLDRPLSVAGRVFFEEGGGRIGSCLVNLDRDLLVIPNLAIHMNREMNKGYAYNPQVDLLPIFTDNKEGSLRSIIAAELAMEEDRLLSEELFAYVRQKGCVLGEKGQWIMAPRLDDLQCAYAIVEGMLQAKPEHYIALGVFFDNEEVGSSTKQGADSDFLEQVIGRIGHALALNIEERGQLLEKSFLISADNANALHPNHPEKADPTNRPKLNGGIVIKYHGGQKYTTDGYSSAYLIQLCKNAGIKYQSYCNRSDIPGGSTLGNLSETHVSVPSVDIGFAQLAMHSAVETAGREDIGQGIRLFGQYWSK